MVILRAFVLVLVFDTVCFAYGDTTHRNVVRDAFEFIIANKGDSTTKYPDGATPKSDYDLVLRVLSIKPGATADAQLRKIAMLLGTESVNTDRFPDVTLTLPWYYPTLDKDRTQISGYYFTLFSHFINVRFPPVFWEHDGYSYKSAQQNAQCVGGPKDLLANFLIDHSNGTVNTLKSTPYLTYRQPLQPNIDATDYEKHFQQKLEDIRFWPITALAKYWFESFLKSPKDLSGTPLNLVHIAPALHAAADTTVPFHAVAMSGCGHVAYEDLVDGLYVRQPNSVYDPSLVKSFLGKTAHLNSTLPIVALISKNAEFAADNRFCACTTIACDCSLALNNRGSARELANLAIAATVIVLRKGFTEWSPGSGPASRLPASPDPRGRVLRFRKLEEINVAPPFVAGSEKPSSVSIGDRLFSSLTTLKNAASEIERLPVTDFRGRLNNAIAVVRGATAGSTEMWDPLEMPRWTAQNPPLIDTSNLAISEGDRDWWSFTLWPRPDASRCGPWCASSVGHT